MESESDQLKMSHIQAYKDIFLSTTCLLRVKKLRLLIVVVIEDFIYAGAKRLVNWEKFCEYLNGTANRADA